MPPVRLGFSGRNPRKISGMTQKSSQSFSWNSPREYGWDAPSPRISRHLKPPEHFQNSLPLRMAEDASCFRIGSTNASQTLPFRHKPRGCTNAWAGLCRNSRGRTFESCWGMLTLPPCPKTAIGRAAPKGTNLRGQPRRLEPQSCTSIGPWYGGVQNVWGAGKRTRERALPKILGPLQKSFWPAPPWILVQEKQSTDTWGGWKTYRTRGGPKPLFGRGVIREVFHPPLFSTPLFRKRADSRVLFWRRELTEPHWVLGQTQWVLGKTRWVRFGTQIIGGQELTEFCGFLRVPAVFRGFLRFSAEVCTSRKAKNQHKSAKIC